MAEGKELTYIKWFFSWNRGLDILPEDLRGRLYTLLMGYAETRVTPDLDSLDITTKALFLANKGNIDSVCRSFDNTCLKRAHSSFIGRVQYLNDKGWNLPELEYEEWLEYSDSGRISQPEVIEILKNTYCSEKVAENHAKSNEVERGQTGSEYKESLSLGQDYDRKSSFQVQDMTSSSLKEDNSCSRNDMTGEERGTGVEAYPPDVAELLAELDDATKNRDNTRAMAAIKALGDKGFNSNGTPRV